jgi:NADPH2:quinone reductase
VKAILVHAHGDPESLRVEDVPIPEPGPGQVRLRVQAGGVNFVDLYQLRGWYKVKLPHPLGLEAGGVIDAVGPDVAGIRPGDRAACASAHGAYAEYALAPAARVVPLPPEIDTPTATALMSQGLTAHAMAFGAFPLRPGHVALVHAAAGGVGLLLTQMAKRAGARVLATVSSEEKANLAREAGADDVIVYTHVDFEPEVKRLTEGRGVDVVYDSVGRDTFDRGLNSLRVRGTMVLYGQASGPVPPLDPQVLNQKGGLFLTRPSLGHYTATRDELLARTNDVFSWVAGGSLRVRIDRSYPIERAGEALADLASRRTAGKLLLVP